MRYVHSILLLLGLLSITESRVFSMDGRDFHNLPDEGVFGTIDTEFQPDSLIGFEDNLGDSVPFLYGAYDTIFPTENVLVEGKDQENNSDGLPRLDETFQDPFDHGLYGDFHFSFDCESIGDPSIMPDDSCMLNEIPLEVQEIEVEQNDQQDSTPDRSKKRTRESRRFTCEVCKINLCGKQALERHLSTDKHKRQVKKINNIQKSDKERPFVCTWAMSDGTQCGKDFTKNSQLKVHVKNQHGKGYACKQCTRHFYQFNNLKEHVKADHEEAYKCDVCKIKFSRKQCLEEHLKSNRHKNQVKFDCEPTGHPLIVTDDSCIVNEIPLEIQEIDEPEVPQQNVHQMSLQLGHVPNVQEVEQHGFAPAAISSKKRTRENSQATKDRQPKKRRKTGDKEKSFVCNLKMSNGSPCGKGFTRNSYLMLHIKGEHEEAFSCEVCKINFFSGQVLERHLSTDKHKRQVKKINNIQKSDKERPFVCTWAMPGGSQCGKDFTKNERLTAHVKRQHGEGFLCKQCGRRFGQTCNLKEHMKADHEGAYQCDVCDINLSSKQRLEEHLGSNKHKERVKQIRRNK